MAADDLKFPIAVPVETNAEDAASSVEALRDSILSGTDAIRAMSASARNLRGSTDEVKAAKASLKAKIEATKDAVSSSTLALVKQGTSYDAVAQKAKRYADAAKKLKSDEIAKAKERTAALSAAVTKAGGPVAALRGRLDELRAVAGGVGGAMGLATLAVAGTIAAVVAMAAAVVGAGVSLAKFIMGATNTARSAGLMREAWAGSAKNAGNLGSQVDALANKVPTSTAALNELAISLMKTKMSGAATVDAFNAVGQASAALGDSAGAKIQEFITRGRIMGRMRIDPYEMLEGFGGLEFNDIAAELAKSTGKGIKDARDQLFMGRAKLDDGAKAIRAAVEKRFGELNMRKMLDLNVLSEKLQQKWANLTSGVKLEPLLKPLGELLKLFDDSTVTGATLKRMMTAFGNGMVGALERGIPLAKTFFQGLIIGSLRAYITFLDLRNAFRKTFGDQDLFKGVDVLGVTLKTAEIAAGALAISLGVVAAALASIVIMADKAYKALSFVTGSVEANNKALGGGKMSTGKAITDGLIGGIVPGGAASVLAVKSLAAKVKNAFAGPEGIDAHSPSLWFKKQGKNAVDGWTGGLSENSDRAANASRGMIAANSVSKGGGSTTITIPITIHAGGGAAKELSSPAFLALLTKTLEDALVGAGIPVQA